MTNGMYEIVSNRRIAQDTYEMVLQGDLSFAENPGQFVNIKLEGLYLRRPISICDWDDATLTLIYKVVGKGTQQLAGMKPGKELDLLCGLGNGFDMKKAGEHSLLFGGGVGVPPLYGLARRMLDTGVTPTVALGFRTGGSCVWTEDFPALMVFNAVYGGTPTSKLFLNVREKLSLCYFASSTLEKCKGILLVSSGIEFGNYDKAKAEILAQLDNCRQGAIEDWEMVAARQAIISSLSAALDAQGRLEDFWLGQAAAGLEEEPQALAQRIAAVTKEQVVAVANKLELDTIYFLKGKEG